MEAIPNPDLETASKARAIRPAEVVVRVIRRRVRWIYRRVVTAKVLAVERIEYVENDCRRLRRRKVDVLLQAQVHVLGSEYVADSEERPRRRRESVGALLVRPKAQGRICSALRNAGAEIHNCAE